MAVFKLFAANPAPEGGASEGVPGELGVTFEVTSKIPMTAWHLYIPTGAKPTFLLLWQRTSTTKGTLLRKQATAVEGSGNWTEIAMTKPIYLEPGKTYMATFYDPLGRYGFTHGVFGAAGVTSGPLHAFKEGEADWVGTARNGCFVFDSERGGLGAGGGGAEGQAELQCPKESFGQTSYHVDVVADEEGKPESPQSIVPDADVTTTGWGATPLWSKVNDGSDGTTIKAPLV